LIKSSSSSPKVYLSEVNSSLTNNYCNKVKVKSERHSTEPFRTIPTSESESYPELRQIFCFFRQKTPNYGVPLKDAWARIQPHGRELRRMGAHGGAWTRTTVKGQSRSSKAKMLRHWTAVRKLLRTTYVNATTNGTAWTHTPVNGNAPSAWTRIARQC